MKRVRAVWAGIFYFLTFIVSGPVHSAALQEMKWVDMSGGINDSDLRTIAVDPANGNTVYISSGSAVYRTVDGGERWDEILSFKGTGLKIRSLAVSLSDSQSIYAGTDDGLYRSTNRGIQWEKIFSGIGEEKGAVLSIAVHPHSAEVLYAGTRSGLFQTRDNGTKWEEGWNLPSDAEVYSLTINHSEPHIVYAVTDKGLYKSSNSGAGWEKLLEAPRHGEERIIADEINIDVMEEILTERKISSVLIDPSKTNTVYAGTSQGLSVSRDAGITWQSVSSLGLGRTVIRHIAMSMSDPEHVFAATDRGVFRYSKDGGMWDELYKGILSSDARYLAFSSTDRSGAPALWVVTGKSVYTSAPSIYSAAMGIPDSEHSASTLGDTRVLFNHEPSIDEIRAAAIEYAEVSPTKIRRWRRAAANRAWLPDVRFAYDRGKDWQSSYTFYKIEDEYRKFDDVTKDSDHGWAVSLTWELGDLIWNNAQTSIDSRSRLMVQLRDDVLNEVTRLYFERRRLQIDMDLSSPADRKTSFERELRLQELTAHIDALTGSYFSRRLAQAGVRAPGSGVQ